MMLSGWDQANINMLELTSQQYVIDTHIEAMLISIHDPKQTLLELADLIALENRLHQLEDKIAYDRNN